MRNTVLPVGTHSKRLKGLTDTQPNDSITLVTELLDDGIRVYFASGALAYWVYCLKQQLLSPGFMNNFDASWNYFDAIGGIAAGAEGLCNARNANSHKKEKIGFAIKELVMSFQLITDTVLTELAQNKVLVGKLAVASLPLGGIGFALCMISSTVNATRDLKRAYRKLDPIYLFSDRLNKYNNVMKKITKLVEKDSNPKIADQIKVLQKKQDRYKNQALAIARVYNKEWQNDVKKKTTTNSLATAGILTNKYSLSNATKTDEALVELLLEKQYNKVCDHALSVSTWASAAIGMSLIAISPFFPPLFLPGIIIAAVAGVLKVFEISKKVYNHKTSNAKKNAQAVVAVGKSDVEVAKELAGRKGINYKDKEIEEAISNNQKVTKKLSAALHKAYAKQEIVSKKLTIEPNELDNFLSSKDQKRILASSSFFRHGRTDKKHKGNIADPIKQSHR